LTPCALAVSDASMANPTTASATIRITVRMLSSRSNQ
jgi:hypothetical protein